MFGSATALLLLYLLEVQTVIPTPSIIFDKTYVGVEFSPYVNQWTKGSVASLESYSIEEIKQMLKVISTKFQKIYTFGFGTKENNFNKHLVQRDSISLVATAAAQVNKEAGTLLLTVSQGVRVSNLGETENAISSSIQANQIYPGTISSLTFDIDSLTTAEFIQLHATVEQLTQKLANDPVKLGIKSPSCDPAFSNKWAGVHLKFLKTFLMEFDYVVCPTKPTEVDMQNGPIYAANRLAEKYNSIFSETGFNIFGLSNASTRLILSDLGWPSLGKSEYGPANFSSTQNLYRYWTEVAKLASEHKIVVVLHEAFDQPYKSNYSITNKNDARGRYGARGHFGWWKKTESGFVEKYLEPEEEFVYDEKVDVVDASNTSLIIAIAILVPLLILTALGLIFVIYKLKVAKSNIEYLTSSEIQEFRKGSQKDSGENTELNCDNLPYNEEYELTKDNLVIDYENVLGNGVNGLVLKGKVNIDGKFQDVAVKTTKSIGSLEHLRRLLSEIKLMIYIGHHPNVVRLIGAYTEEITIGVVYMAAEFCEKGSLETILRSLNVGLHYNSQGWECDNSQYADLFDSTQTKILPRLSQWVFQIAQGMNHLAAKKVVHGDVATRNILISRDNVAKITDFGLSRRLYEQSTYVKRTRDPLPWRWMAIETLKFLNFSTQSDVWSFGVTMWEIYSLGDLPYSGLSWDAKFADDLSAGLRLASPKLSTDMIYIKMMQCWDSEPSKRPSFQNLVDFFNPLTMNCDYICVNT